jgi:6-pyruvoyltetrahydropterin/6-carboxytetrahydropterin synthase
MRITRQYRFAASHRLHSDLLSEGENRRVFGKCNNPFGHGHDYALRVCAEGEPDPETGLLCDISALDRIVEETVLRQVRDRNLNDWDAFSASARVPTTENLAVVAVERIREAWPAVFGAGPRLAGVTIHETRRNSVESRV